MLKDVKLSTSERTTGMMVKMKKRIMKGAIMKYAVLFLLIRNHVRSLFVISWRGFTCFSGFLLMSLSLNYDFRHRKKQAVGLAFSSVSTLGFEPRTPTMSR